MAVAVKNTPETRAPSVLDRLAVASLAGAVYLLGMLWAVFGGLPLLWRKLGLAADSFLGVAGLGLAMLVAFCVLAVAGVRLFGGRPRPGLRAGIFCALMMFLLLLGICRWIAGFIEARVYNNDWFTGTEAQWGGGIAGVLCALVTWWLMRFFFRPGFENFLVRFEEQGWFTARTYKPAQGQRVRRGTILGILLLGGSGIWVLLNRGVLGAESRWDVNVPFTGRVIVTDKGDAPESELLKNAGNQLRVIDAGDTGLKDGTDVSRDKVLEILDGLAKQKLAGLEEVLKKLAAREKQLRDSLKSISQQSARTATEEAADLLKGWRERLEPFRDQLRDFVEAKTDEDKLAAEGNLFLMQREIDRVVRQEQDAEKNRERVKATAQRLPLTDELKWITDWAQKGRLPVLSPIVDRFRVRDINKSLDPNVNRVVRNPKVFEDLPLPEKVREKFKKPGEIITADEDLDKAIEEVKRQLRERGESAEQLKEVEKTMSEAAPPVKPVEGQAVYASIVLLPAVRFTLPVLLLALTLWLAWRVVNLPTFADFLIATEAEMNKVSWTTRHRLYQDTIVVLVTMILLAIFLFLVDIGWHAILSWKPIGVLRQPPPATQKTDEDLKW